MADFKTESQKFLSRSDWTLAARGRARVKLHKSDISPKYISPQSSLSTQRLFKAFFLSVLNGEHLCFFSDQTGRFFGQRRRSCETSEEWIRFYFF